MARSSGPDAISILSLLAMVRWREAAAVGKQQA